MTSTATTARLTPSGHLIPGQSYTARLTSAITDLAGNALVPVTWTVRTSTTVENTSPAFQMIWDGDSDAHASGGTYHAASGSGPSSTFTFTGTNVSLVGLRSPSGGYASVYLDGVLKTSSLSFYNSTTQWQRTMWSASSLPDARHTLRITARGTKPSASTGTWVYVDAFRVSSATYRETNAAVVEAFRRITASSASGGSYAQAGHTTRGDTGGRPTFSVAFKGTRVNVYGVRSASSGSAVIYLDGVQRAVVSLRGTTAYRFLVWSSPSLTSKLHTVRVEVMGTSSGNGSTVSIDNVSIS